MTNRVNAFIVILERDIREDDAESTLNAIKQIRGVLKVKPHLADGEEAIAEARVRADLIGRIFDLLKTT